GFGRKRPNLAPPWGKVGEDIATKTPGPALSRGTPCPVMGQAFAFLPEARRDPFGRDGGAVADVIHWLPSDRVQGANTERVAVPRHHREAGVYGLLGGPVARSAAPPATLECLPAGQA